MQALKDVTFDLPDTGLIIVLGESGSGKTTLLNLLAGTDTPSGGEVIFRRQNIYGKNFPIENYRNTYCSVIFQEYNLLLEFNVEENISFALQMQGNREPEKVGEALKRVGLAGYEKRRINELSGGQQQRVAVARAIAKDSAVILADEPTGALDEETGDEIFALLKELSRERLVVVATHDKELALKYADRVITLAAGEVVSDSGKGAKYEESEVPFAAKRAKLPVKTAVRLGAVNFKRHPWRLFFTLLLSIISFGLFALPVDVALWDNEAAFYRATYENGVAVTSIKKVEDYDVPLGEIESGDLVDLLLGATRTKDFMPLDFTDEDVSFLQSKTEVPLLKMSQDKNFYFQVRMRKLSQEEYDEFNRFMNSDENTQCYHPNSERFIALDEETASAFGFQVTGRLPEGKDEVAINECILHEFEYCGWQNEDGSIEEIQSAEDMLGRKIPVAVGREWARDYTIVGVVNTGCRRRCWLHNAAVHNAFHEGLFISEEAMPSDYFLYYKTPEKQEDYEKFIGQLLDYRTSEGGKVHYSIANGVSAVLNGKKGTVVKRANGLLLWLGAIFFVIAFLFLCTDIAGAIRSQLHEIGILSALGVRTRELIKIYGSVTLILCGVTFAFTLVFTGVGGIFLNRFFATHYFVDTVAVNVCTFHPLVVLFLALSLLAVAAVGCVLPLLHYQRKSSVSVINEGKIK